MSLDDYQRPRVLAIDDEPHVLAALSRQFRRKLDLVTTTDPTTVRDILINEGPFEVVISDMRMPIMNGAQVLAMAHEVAPTTTRLLLTGQSEVEAAAAAVNQGQIFRFLRKPCPPRELAAAIDAAIEHHRLVTAEKVLLEETLKGSVAALVETLAAASPEIFGKAERVRQHVATLLDDLDVEQEWAIDVATTLSQLPLITLPPVTLKKLSTGHLLSDPEARMVSRLPQLGESFIAKIPRLEPVKEIIRYHAKWYDGSGTPADGVRGKELPFGARVLRLALDFEALESQGHTRREACAVLRGRSGRYDPALLDVLTSACEHLQSVREVTFADVEVGMILAADVQTTTGMTVLSRGHAVTPPLQERLRNFAEGVGLIEPMLVLG